MTERNTRIIIFIFVLSLLSIACDSIGYTTSGGADIVLASAPTIDGLWSIFATLWAFITFQIVGVPTFVAFFILMLTVWLVLDLISLVFNRGS